MSKIFLGCVFVFIIQGCHNEMIDVKKNINRVKGLTVHSTYFLDHDKIINFCSLTENKEERLFFRFGPRSGIAFDEVNLKQNRKRYNLIGVSYDGNIYALQSVNANLPDGKTAASSEIESCVLSQFNIYSKKEKVLQKIDTCYFDTFIFDLNPETNRLYYMKKGTKIINVLEQNGSTRILYLIDNAKNIDSFSVSSDEDKIAYFDMKSMNVLNVNNKVIRHLDIGMFKNILNDHILLAPSGDFIFFSGSAQEREESINVYKYDLRTSMVKQVTDGKSIDIAVSVSPEMREVSIISYIAQFDEKEKKFFLTGESFSEIKRIAEPPRN